MGSSAIDEGMEGAATSSECMRVSEEPTLTQMVEEGLDEAVEDQDEEDPAE